MIIVRNCLSDNTTLEQTYNNPALAGELRKLGIKLDKDAETYNFTLILANSLKGKNLEGKKNLIAIEKIDGAQITLPQILKHESVVMYLKQYHYADYTINNQSAIDNRLFTRYLGEPDELTPPGVIITRKDSDKIYSGLNFLHYARHQVAVQFSRNINLSRKREVDVLFAGTTEYGDESHKSGRLITKHRKAAVEAIRKLGSKYKILLHDSRAMTGSEYYTAMTNAKITISPWGWGEACYREYEAILLGMEVIKPWAGEIKSEPALYTKDADMLTFCKPDFSDVPEIVERLILNHRANADNRLRRRDKLMQCRTERAQAAQLAKIITPLVGSSGAK